MSGNVRDRSDFAFRDPPRGLRVGLLMLRMD